MKTKKYLEFYEKCMEAGHLIAINGGYQRPFGLCAALEDPALDLFEPTYDDCEQYGVRTWWYWADPNDDSEGVLNEMRQNIVLFLAAMNGEL